MLNHRGASIGIFDVGCISYIRCLSEQDPSMIARFPYVWISRLDSDRSITNELSSFSALAQYEREVIQRKDRKIIVSGPTVVKAALADNFFNGFDEIWCFQRVPPEELPQSVYIAARQWLKSPNYIGNPGGLTLEQIVEWMKRSGSVVGLADGDCLNYVAQDASYAHELEDNVLSLHDLG